MQRPFPVSDELFPFESRWIEIDGLRVHYIDEGDGPVLLLLHGNPTWSFLYRDIIVALRSQFRCIAPDYPGMGMSAKPRDCGRPDYGFTPAEHSAVIERFVDALGLSAITMMVQDWGGPIGMGVATRRPDRFARLVIGNTWAWPLPHTDARLFSLALGRGPGRWAILNFNTFVERLLPAGVSDKSRLTDEVMAAYRGPYPTKPDREPTAVFPREITASRGYLAEVEHGLPRLADKPVLLVWGNRDPVFRHRELARWQSVFPHAHLRILDGASHFIQEDAPAEIAEAISAFVES